MLIYFYSANVQWRELMDHYSHSCESYAFFCEKLSVNNELQTWKLRAKFEDRSDKCNTQTLPNPYISKLFTKLKWNASNGTSSLSIVIIRIVCCMKVHFVGHFVGSPRNCSPLPLSLASVSFYFVYSSFVFWCFDRRLSTSSIRDI